MLAPPMLFLDRASNTWPAQLDNALYVLRVMWEDDWCGLPQVLSRCCDFLQIDTLTLSDQHQALYETARDIAHKIESTYAQTALGEPCYHNRLHTSDVLVCLTLQAAIESESLNGSATSWLLTCLLTGLVHDFMHPGTVNNTISEIEEHSINAVRPIFDKHGLAKNWQENIAYAVLRSDFSLATENHRLVKGEAFTWNRNWMAVLLNESDIMASCTLKFGPALSSALADEWQQNNVPAYAKVATTSGRLAFLKNIQFSSRSAYALDLPTQIELQISARSV